MHIKSSLVPHISHYVAVLYSVFVAAVVLLLFLGGEGVGYEWIAKINYFRKNRKKDQMRWHVYK